MALTQDRRPTTRWAATPSSRELAFLSLVGAVFFFGGWQLIAMSGLVSQYILPSPLAVLEQIYQLETEPFAGFVLHQHLLSSLERFMFGFLLAAALGIPLGLIMGRYRVLDEIVTPLFEAYRYVAPLAWVPFAALWFGTGIGGPVMVIFTGAFAPCVVNAYRGAHRALLDRSRADARCEQSSNHARGAAARGITVHCSWSPSERGTGLAITHRRGVDRGLVWTRVRDGAGSKQSCSRHRYVCDAGDRRGWTLHRRSLARG